MVALLITPPSLAAPAQDATHLGIAHEIVNVLSDVEVCLNTCRDSESIQQALPHLEEAC